MNKTINVALLGAGTIGTGVLEVLKSNHNSISCKVGADIKVKTVLETSPKRTEELKQDYIVTNNFDDIVKDKDIQIVIELIGREEPARTFILQALEAGKHVVTANKDVIAKFGQELFAAAAKNNVNLLFEASVGGGIPIIRPLKQCLIANNIDIVMGIVNGTTNYMLTKMTKEKMEYADVLKEAQDLGYAESDPTADVGGFDPARKIAILGSIAFNSRFSIEDVNINGIEKITAKDIEYASDFGYVIKLLAIAQSFGEEGVNLRVHPTLLPNTHPLASVNDSFNAIFVRGDVVGDTMFYGRGAGQRPTASAIIADVMDVARDIELGNTSKLQCSCYDHRLVCPSAKVLSPYYIRLTVSDRPGALAAIAAAFGSQQVSLAKVLQQPLPQSGFAELVLVTHNVSTTNIEMAVQTLEVMTIIGEVCNVIRIME